MAYEIITERLRLVEMKEDDAELVLRWRNQKRIKEILQTKLDTDLTIKDHLEWFRSSRSSRFDYIVSIKDEKIPIGVWSFKPAIMNNVGNCMEQGRYIGNINELGKGYAKEASLAWTCFGFDCLKLDNIISLHKIDNYKPQLINKSIGFVYDNINSTEEGFVRMILSKENFYSTKKEFWGEISIKEM